MMGALKFLYVFCLSGPSLYFAVVFGRRLFVDDNSPVERFRTACKIVWFVAIFFLVFLTWDFVWSRYFV